MMFKNETDLEKIVGRLKIHAEPNPAHRESLRREMLSVFDETTQQSQKRTTQLGVFRRIIMKSPIAKITAAAAIIIVAILVLHNGSVDVVTPAFGLQDVLDALKETEWVHCVVKVEQVNVDTKTAEKMGIGGWESWESVHPSYSIEKHDNGKVYFTEKDTGKTSRYDPRTNRITVVYKDPPSSQETYDSLADKYVKELAEVEKKGDNVKYEEGVYEGRPVQIVSFDATSEGGLHTTMSVSIDSETYLPKKYTAQQTLPKKGLHGTISGIFDYPETGPEDIYAVGVPRTAEIVDKTDVAAENPPQ